MSMQGYEGDQEQNQEQNQGQTAGTAGRQSVAESAEYQSSSATVQPLSFYTTSTFLLGVGSRAPVLLFLLACSARHDF